MKRLRTLRDLGPWWLVAVVVGAGLARVLFGHVRGGGVVVAAGIFLAAILRLVLPAPRGGGLEVRSRPLDVALLLVLGAAVLVAFRLVAVTLPG